MSAAILHPDSVYMMSWTRQVGVVLMSFTSWANLFLPFTGKEQTNIYMGVP